MARAKAAVASAVMIRKNIISMLGINSLMAMEKEGLVHHPSETFVMMPFSITKLRRVGL